MAKRTEYGREVDDTPVEAAPTEADLRLAQLEEENRALKARMTLMGKRIPGVPTIGTRQLVGCVRKDYQSPWLAVQIVADAETFIREFKMNASTRYLECQIVPIELFKGQDGRTYERAEDIKLLPWPGKAKTLKGRFFEE